MAQTHLRFRKTVTVIPGFLFWTVSKTGSSVRLKIGPYSRSFGTRMNSTSIDMPGTSGIGWQKREVKGGKGESDHAAEEGASWVWFAVFAAAMMGLGRWWVMSLLHAETFVANPVTWWAVIVAVVGAGAIWAARRVGTLGDIAIALASLVGLWALFQWLIVTS